jgi:hypothetical protein
MAFFCADTEQEGTFSNVDTIKDTFNRAEKWTGGLRRDHEGGTLTRCHFEGSSAVVSGGATYMVFDSLQILHFSDRV